MAAALRLGGFLVLISALFLIAYAAGAGVGPVTLVHGHSGPSGSGGMHMGTVRQIGRRS